MTKYLITHHATIGRVKSTVEGEAPTVFFPPVDLIFYSMVEAESVDAASEKVVQYSDPGFITRVANISEVADTVSSAELFALLNHKKVIVETKG